MICATSGIGYFFQLDLYDWGHGVNILRHICPLLGNGSVNTSPKNTLSTIEEHQLLGNRQINTHSRQKKTVFSVWSVPKACKKA
jgi:hypothetical protein